MRVLSSASSLRVLFAPSCRPPFWSWVQLVEESSLCRRNEAVASRPTLLSCIARRERATFLVQRATAFAESFAVLQCGLQILHLVVVCCGASQALELAAFIVLEIIQGFDVEVLHAECHLACLTSI